MQPHPSTTASLSTGSLLADSLQGKEVVLGITGSIACYKGVEVLRTLKQAGAHVSVIMTKSACQFVAPLTFQTLSQRPVTTELFNLDQESLIGHIELAEKADALLIAPCTASMLTRICLGLADDALSAVALATKAPIYLAPAMNDGMWENPITQCHVAQLKARGVTLIGPGYGFLAEGKTAIGRMSEPAEVVEQFAQSFSAPAQQALEPNSTAVSSQVRSFYQGKRVLITAGATREMIDPVRFISNRSSGKMGYALASAFQQAGAEVILIAGLSALTPPAGVTHMITESAAEMHTAALQEQPNVDMMVCAAAVSDYRMQTVQENKMKRAENPTLTLNLVPNPDIAAELGRRKTANQLLVVFAAESEDLEENAKKKLISKSADLVVANDIGLPNSGFDSDYNQVLLIARTLDNSDANGVTHLAYMPKQALAAKLVEHMAGLLPLAESSRSSHQSISS